MDEFHSHCKRPNSKHIYGEMKNITPLILAALMLVMGLLVFNAGSAFMQDGKPKVEIVHMSASKMSDGSLTVYCMFTNRDTVPATDVRIDVYALDSLGNVLAAKELLFFSTNSIKPDQKALFTESFPDCWECDEVKVVPR